MTAAVALSWRPRSRSFSTGLDRNEFVFALFSLLHEAGHERFLYTEGVQAQWRETIVGEDGELVLKGLPFKPGEPVEVLVVSKTAGSTAVPSESLRNSVLEFLEPFEPVAVEDWDALH